MKVVILPDDVAVPAGAWVLQPGHEYLTQMVRVDGELRRWAQVQFKVAPRDP
jgi:hypothetical protein